MTTLTRTPETFDYVIVGAGAAGAILSHRLSEDRQATVCLLEAGGSDWHPWLHIPAGFIKVLFNPAYTWQFSSEPHEQTSGRRVPLPQGRVLGGSSSINGLVYNRGQREDYDHWATLGNRGWSYAEVLPYFRRTERRMTGDERYRGREGMLPVSDIDWHHPINEAFIAGAQGLGMPRNPDYNGAKQEGVGYFQRTIDQGWRMSTSRTFLWPVKGRPNLDIRTHAQVTRLVLEGRRAQGVRYARDRDMHEVRARREVIVCAGAINTPRLLQLSGIGDAEHLQSQGIRVAHHLPGVGQNLSDHFSIRLVARAKNVRTMNEMARGLGLVAQVVRWLLGKPSILALSPSLVHFFWKSRADLVRPDLQGVFSPASYREGYVGMLDNYPGMTCGVWQHRPDSRGQVLIRGADPFAPPLVQPNYLADERDRTAGQLPIIEDGELHVEDGRLFGTRLCFGAHAQVAKALTRHFHGTLEARDFRVDAIVIDEPMTDLGHLPSQEMHGTHDDSRRSGNAAEDRQHSAFSEPGRDQCRERVERLVSIGSGCLERDDGPVFGGQHHDAHDALAIHLEVVARDGDVGLELRGHLHHFGSRARVQPMLVHDLDGSFSHQRTTE